MFDLQTEDGGKQYTRPNGVTYTKAALSNDDLYGRLASCKDCHPALQAFLIKYGYDQATTETELAHKLSSVVMNHGLPSLKDITLIHPDRELILSFYTPPVVETPATIQKPEQKPDLHDCGCGATHNAAGGDLAPAATLPTPTPVKATPPVETSASATHTPDDYSKYMKPALLISVSLLLVAVVWKKL